MEYGKRERGSITAAPLAAGGVTAHATPRGNTVTAHMPQSTAYSEGSSSAGLGAGLRPVLKPFGPVQQQCSTKGNVGYCFASGLPARRRLLGRRQQQQAQKQQEERGTANNSTHSNAGPSSVESSSVCSSSQRKRPTIKAFLGVNPADIILPLLSPPQEEANRRLTRNAPQKQSRGAGSSGGVLPLTFSSGQSAPPQQEPEPRMHFLRQKSSALSSFITRLLPFGGVAATCAQETAPNTDDTTKSQEQRQQAKEEPGSTVGGAPVSLARHATVQPPGIIARSSQPLVPAFNASDGNEPVWKPIVYESEPIYLLPDGSVSNPGMNTQATTNTTPLRNETRTMGTIPGYAVSTSGSCVVSAPCAPAEEDAPRAPAYGSSSAQEQNCPVSPIGVQGSGAGFVPQTPAPLTASSLPEPEDPSEQTGAPLTNYQRYLKWKEQQRKQQLLFERVQMEQHQQQIRDQWMKTIEPFLPETGLEGGYFSSPQLQGQPFYAQQHQWLAMQQKRTTLQQQQELPFEPQQQPLNAEQQVANSQQPPYELQQQQFMPNHQTLDSQQHPQLSDNQHQSQAGDQQQLDFVEEQQYEQYDEQQQADSASFQNPVTALGQGPEDAPPTWVNHPQQHSVQQHQQNLRENRLTGNYSQVLQQWEIARRAMQHPFQNEICHGGLPTTSHQHSLPQASLAHLGKDTEELAEKRPPFPTPCVPEGKDFQNPSGAYSDDLEAAGHLMPQAEGAKQMPNFFPQPAYVPQPPPFSNAMKPVAGFPYHPGFNYAEGISVHYNYYDAEEWTSKLQATATQREDSGSTQAGAEQEALRDASGGSLSLSSDGGEESAVAVGLKPLLTSKYRLPSGQVFAR